MAYAFARSGKPRCWRTYASQAVLASSRVGMRLSLQVLRSGMPRVLSRAIHHPPSYTLRLTVYAYTRPTMTPLTLRKAPRGACPIEARPCSLGSLFQKRRILFMPSYSQRGQGSIRFPGLGDDGGHRLGGAVGTPGLLLRRDV